MIHVNQPPWLLLLHVLPARPTSLRVRTWRRLQDLGAVSLKNAAWVLPNTDQAREDFEWIRTEIRQMGGEATVMAADGIDAFSTDQITMAFRRAREVDFDALERDARRLASASQAARARGLPRLTARLARLEAITHVAPPNRSRVVDLVTGLQTATAGPARTASGVLSASSFHGRIWVTRPRPGIDRMASAWLIRRLIDPAARFRFADRPPSDPRQVPFDMFGVELGHSAHGCTFETLITRFGLAAPPLDRIARIVHDVDLKDSKFQPVEAPAFIVLIDGFRLTFDDDAELLERGMTLFEALYRSFDAAGRVRAAARRQPSTSARARARSARKARR